MSLVLARPSRGALRVVWSAAAILVVVLVGCKTDPVPAIATYCDAVRSTSKTCEEPSPCDGALVTSCGNLDKALSVSTVTAAKDCLESGVCGAASCLSRARTGAQPTPAHLALAHDFCTACASEVVDCEGQFYAKKSKLPGSLVLPYGESVAAAVDEACTSEPDTCRAKFATCATETIARVVGDAFDPDLAECVLSGFRRDGEATGPGGGPTIATCTPANCKGCCRDDKCEKGDSEETCGVGAQSCELCGGAQECKGGKCSEPCGPNNCPGCCDGDTCVAGTTPATCGGGGGACSKCTGTTLACSNKKCIDNTCKATCTSGCCSATGCEPGTAVDACGKGGEGCVDCGYGRTCNATLRTCVIDPNALWDFYVSFAVVPDKNKDGGTWDILSGPPDGYLIAFSSQTASTHTGQTTVQDNSTVPFWAETPLVGVKASELLNNLSFEVWDSDTDADDYIGGCKLPVTPSIFDGSLQSYVCPATPSGVEVKLYYRINKHR